MRQLPYCVAIKLEKNVEYIQKMETAFNSSPNISKESPRLTHSQLKQHTPTLIHLEKLLHNETSLTLHRNVHPTLTHAYQQATTKLQHLLRKVELTRWSPVEGEQITSLQEKIKATLYKLTKLKQINIYFNDLKKESGVLEADVEKFLFYKPKDNELQQKLEEFLTETTVSELILKQYEKSFNPNNFAADVISFFQFLHSNKLVPIQTPEPYLWIRNTDLVLIQNTNIIFRQVCEISDKYTLVEQQLQKSYIHLDFISTCNSTDSIQNRYRVETEAVDHKMKRLKMVAQKVKRQAGNIQGLVANNETIILPEEPDLFESISKEFEFSLKEKNQNFSAFLQELYEGKPAVETSNEANFNFIRLKIIKAEMRWHLNRIFSAFNLASHIIGLLHNNITPTPNHYTFQEAALLIKYELNSKMMSFYSERLASEDELELLCRDITVVQKEKGFVLQLDRSKVVYPSALHNYYYLLKYLLCLSTVLQEKQMYSDELLLEITSIKADELMQWAQTGLNLLEMIKRKYYGCYGLLKEYIQLVFKVDWLYELEYVRRQIKNEQVSDLLSFYTSKEKKAGWINQIIFELDSGFDVQEPLRRFVEIERHHRRTNYTSDHHYFYQLILNQIIQTRNNLKFDRCYSFSALHQLFGVPSARPANIRELAQKLTPISHTRMRLADLLRFYESQSRLKRQVFKAQLYWISIAEPSVRNKFIISNQKKKVSFRDFLEENARYLLGLNDKSLDYFLDNLQQIERAVLLFGHEVERLKLIQCSLLLLKPDFPLEDHLSAFNCKQLQGFFSYCSQFNFVEDIFVRRDKSGHLLSSIKKLLQYQPKIKFSELNVELQMVTLRNILAGFIFVTYAFGHHYTREDCLALKSKVIDQGELPECHLKIEIWRSKRQILKQYQECQLLESDSLIELVQIYELLMLQAFNRVLSRDDIPAEDKELMQSIREELPSYEPFHQLDKLRESEKTKHFAGLSSKAHTYARLKSILEDYKEKKSKGKAYSIPWPTMEYLFTLTEIGTVSRRIFCNELIQLKYQICTQQWKNFNKETSLQTLKNLFERQLIQNINKVMVEELNSTQVLNPNHNFQNSLLALNDICRKQLVEQYDNAFIIETVEQRNIVLFDQIRGVQTEYKEGQNMTATNTPKVRSNVKRGLLNTIQVQDPLTAELANSLCQKVNLEIVKESLPTRKLIYQLQLQQQRIKGEIAWQTCKLQHNVISNINHFIEESNEDQKQSLINFKYTVNLQTIKGIENVIHERTQMIAKNQTDADGFLTQPKPERSKRNIEQSLLDINVKNMFNHVKKIKVFWAWKNIYLNKQCGTEEWSKFSQNTEKILYNKENMTKISRLQQLRQTCSKQQTLCHLIRQENGIFNKYIQTSKINHLNSKLKEFKEKHGVEHRNSVGFEAKGSLYC